MAATNISTATAADMPSPEEVLQDVEHLIALRPPTDPATGEMVGPPQSAEYAAYREALQDIVSRYGTMETFQKAAGLPDPAAASGPQLAPVTAPGPPNFTATPPAEVTLAQFAQRMRAPGPGPTAASAAPNAGLPALMSRRGTGTAQ